MRVGIIGAGPAGTVCALSVLRGAREQGQHHEVFLFDGKAFASIGPQGCNMCAGVITSTLLDFLGPEDAETREAVIQRYIDGHDFETLVGSVHIPKEPGVTLCTVFRSAGPRGCAPIIAQSFDTLLLGVSERLGARHISAHVLDVRLPLTPHNPFHLTTEDGQDYTVDVLVGAFGVNSALAKRFEELGIGYRRPHTYHVCQAEIPLEPDFIASQMRNAIQIFSLALPGISFGALTPKREHVTVTVIGRHVKQADLARFLSHPVVVKHFPPEWRMPAHYCHCHPQLPVSAARHPVSDRLLMVGDACIARYLKGGIESAFFTGRLAARMILDGALTAHQLRRGYVRPCKRRYYYDNRWGRMLFVLNDLISHFRPLARLGLWLLQQEERMPDWNDRPHTQLLWHIFTGDAPYREIALSAISPRACLAIARVLLRSVRACISRKSRG